MFMHEAKRVQAAMGKTCLALHHVGSTSVPGLPAKPIIDMVAEVSAFVFDHQMLLDLGYIYCGGYSLPLRKSFTYRSDRVSVNLHVFEQGDPEVALNILFRDYLRKHPEACQAYAALKDTLAKDPKAQKKTGVYKGYTLGKHAWIQETLKRAKWDGVRFVFCAHDLEWKAVRRLCKDYFSVQEGKGHFENWTRTHPDHKHFALYKGVEIIGYAHVQQFCRTKATLLLIVIDKEYQRKGYGRILINLIKKWLKFEGHSHVCVQEMQRAQKFFTGVGFVLAPSGSDWHALV